MDRPGEDASVPRQSSCDMGERGGAEAGSRRKGGRPASVGEAVAGSDTAQGLDGTGLADARGPGAGVGLAELARMAERADLVVDLGGVAELEVVHPHVARRVDDLLEALGRDLVREGDGEHRGTSLSTYCPGLQT